jgi:hypothetical protein
MHLKLLLISLLIFIACNKGIEPEPEGVDVGFSGTITFIGEWDPNVTSTNIVLFREPILSAANFSITNINYASEVIPFGSKTYNFNTSQNSPVLNTIEPGDYAYLAVAQTTEPSIMLTRSAWVVVGIYVAGKDSSQTGKISVPSNSFLTDVNIICDFNNPPPQPPGGN